jgi:serine/threonine-protein kinase RsbW
MPPVDEIVLTLPRERPFYGVAHLVLGGLAARLDLTFENLEDLQLALDSLFEQDAAGELTVRLRISPGTIEAHVGPFANSLREELEREQTGVGLRRILDTVVDHVELGEEQGDAWVTLTKNVDGQAAVER